MAIFSIHKAKVGAFLFLVFSISYGIATYQIPLMFYAEEDAFSPRTLPLALAACGIIVSLAMLLMPPVSDPEVKDQSLGGALRGLEWKKVGQLTLLMVLYGLAIKTLGFILSTTIFLIGGFWILGERRLKVLLLASIPLVLVFWFIMVKILEVYLAPGSLFYFLGVSQ